MTEQYRLKRLRFRAAHRGIKEADLMLGGFVDRHGAGFSDADIGWMEALLDEQDVDIMAWITKAQPVPARYDTPLMRLMQRLDYIPHAGR